MVAAVAHILHLCGPYLFISDLTLILDYMLMISEFLRPAPALEVFALPHIDLLWGAGILEFTHVCLLQVKHDHLICVVCPSLARARFSIGCMTIVVASVCITLHHYYIMGEIYEGFGALLC